MAKKRKRKTRRPLWRWLSRFTLLLFAGLLVVVGLYAIHLDRKVTTQFEGKRWELPARVYARPLDLFPGRRLRASDFEQELKLLHYRKVKQVSQPGEYQSRGGKFTVFTRSFPFTDGVQPSIAVSLQFSDGVLDVIQSRDKKQDVALLRLEPALIANIYPKHHEDRVLVKRENVPELLVQSLLVVEDQDFYQHFGVRPTSILRAILANIKAGKTVQGGSTLTQQLVKNFYLSSEQTLTRKLKEAIMALSLEWHYDKDEILEAYLNEIYLGQDGNRAIHGFGLASRFYFQRPLEELQTEQIALLVAIVKGASWYDPRRNPERALKRRNLVIDTMVAEDKIAAEFASTLKKKPLGVSEKAPSGITPFPAFLQLVRAQLQRDYREEDLQSEGLVVFTTLDPLIQLQAEKAVHQGLQKLEKSRRLPAGTLEAAVVVVSAEAGEVQAIVGGRDPRYPGFNRALETQRPIGSLIKPAVYLTALQQNQKWTLSSLLEDAPFTVELRTGDWTPKNYDKEYHGQVRLLDALVHSYNVPTARLGMTVGLKKIRNTLKSLGIERDINRYPSMLLGAVELPPIEIAQMYQTIAGNGYRTPLRAILSVIDPQGETLQRYPLTIEQSISSEADYLLQVALHEVTVSGTARALQNLLPEKLAVAGKTGTTNNLRDSWFAGFSGEHVVVSWVGRDDNQPTGLTGASGALRIWADILNGINTQPLQPLQPDDVEWSLTDIETGALAGEGCANTQWLPFVKGTEPQTRIECSADAGQPSPALDWLRGLFRR
ncbi:MAG TPA: penicillin-binding protein 1B [Chromatiales bacterium]|nr:penicillin-binding protein 1B [Thiotrichales bacterium]HIP68047.1 penicillin-binding protein 1B [Chromatiales bacterium]